MVVEGVVVGAEHREAPAEVDVAARAGGARGGAEDRLGGAVLVDGGDGQVEGGAGVGEAGDGGDGEVGGDGRVMVGCGEETVVGVERPIPGLGARGVVKLDSGGKVQGLIGDVVQTVRAVAVSGHRVNCVAILRRKADRVLQLASALLISWYCLERGSGAAYNCVGIHFKLLKLSIYQGNI